MLPVYFYAKLKLTRISEIIIICSSVCIGLVFSYFLKSTPYGLYFDRHMDFELNFIVFFFIVFFIFIIWHKDRIIQNEKLNIIYNIGLLSIVVFILMFENPNVGANLFLRLNNYFMVVNIVLIGLIPSLFKEHSIKNMVNILVIIGICSLFLRTIIDKGIIYQLVPYEMSVNYFLK